jgi:hypothetical protein
MVYQRLFVVTNLIQTEGLLPQKRLEGYFNLVFLLAQKLAFFIDNSRVMTYKHVL